MTTKEIQSDYLLEAQFRKNKSQGNHVNEIRTTLLGITELHYNILYWRMNLLPARIRAFCLLVEIRSEHPLLLSSLTEDGWPITTDSSCNTTVITALQYRKSKSQSSFLGFVWCIYLYVHMSICIYAYISICIFVYMYICIYYT